MPPSGERRTYARTWGLRCAAVPGRLGCDLAAWRRQQVPVSAGPSWARPAAGTGRARRVGAGAAKRPGTSGRRAEPRPSLAQLPLWHRDLAAKRHDLHVLVPAAHRQQPQEREHVRHIQVKPAGAAQPVIIPQRADLRKATSSRGRRQTEEPLPPGEGIAPRRPERASGSLSTLTCDRARDAVCGH